jgi:hypothetical protein
MANIIFSSEYYILTGYTQGSSILMKDMETVVRKLSGGRDREDGNSKPALGK